KSEVEVQRAAVATALRDDLRGSVGEHAGDNAERRGRRQPWLNDVNLARAEEDVQTPDWREIPLPISLEVYQLGAGYRPELTLERASGVQGRDNRAKSSLVQCAYELEQLLLGAPNLERGDRIEDRVTHASISSSRPAANATCAFHPSRHIAFSEL